MFGNVTTSCLTLDPHACLPQWRSRGESCWFHVSPATQKGVGAGPQSQGLRMSQVYGEVYQWGVPVELRHREDRTSTSLTSLPALKSGVRLSFLWKTMKGLLSLTKQKKASTENEFRGITILFVEDITGPRYIKESRVCICPEVQGISEVCLNTNRIVGQHPVRGMVHRLRELETDEKTHQTTDVDIETDDIVSLEKNSHIKLQLKKFTHKIEYSHSKTFFCPIACGRKI